jgi:hypothetical protein
MCPWAKAAKYWLTSIDNAAQGLTEIEGVGQKKNRDGSVPSPQGLERLQPDRLTHPGRAKAVALKRFRCDNKKGELRENL